MAERFYLIDGHAQIFRAYYAPMAALTSATGEPTRATYIFTQMLLSLIRDKSPDYLAVALDAGDTPTFRDQWYPDYKANREPTPEDLHPQVDRIVEILESQKIPIFRLPGFEADDLMATVADRLADQNIEIFLVSRDKDLHQLLTSQVRMWDPYKNVVMDPETLEEKLGFRPDQAVEIQALTGDNVDNIPGIKGVGNKTAARLIAKYGRAEAVIDHADELTPKLCESVKAYAEQLPLTRRLVTLKRDAPMEFALDDCRWHGLLQSQLSPIFRQLGFSSLLSQLEESTPGKKSPATTPQGANDGSVNYKLVNDEESLDAFLRELRNQKRFAFDTETTGLSPLRTDLVGIAFSWQAGEAYYLPIRSLTGKTLDRDAAFESLADIFSDPAVEKCGQNLKFDILVLRAAGLAVRGAVFDSMIASYLLDASRERHSLDYLVEHFLGHKMIPITDLIGKGKDQLTMDLVDLELVSEYAAEDADYTWRLCELLEEQIRDSGLRNLFEEVEMPLMSVLEEMEYAGVALDTSVLEAMSHELAGRIEEIRDDIFRIVGRDFNLDSPKQLAEVLFDELGLPSKRKTKTGRSTDAAVLAFLVAETQHAVPALVAEYRELSKLKNTYVDTLPQMCNAKTGRIHASFNQTIAATGRLSSSDPNLQNIPIRTAMGGRIREAFKPSDPANVLVAADYSQIELRMLAHFSGDTALTEAFARDADIHAVVASQVFDLPVEEVTGEQRTRAKAVNFGIIYGQGAMGLAQTLGIRQSEAARFIREYKARYPGIVEFMVKCVEQAREHGYVETILGRRRKIPMIDSSNRQSRSAAERLAINTVIQGSATADLIKLAMINIDRRIRDEERSIKLLIQVHDELIFESPREEVEDHAEMIRHEMIHAMEVSVPIKVDISWGDNWQAAK
jgi:DNA polymerase-1